MAKKKGNVYGQVIVYEKKFNRTSIGRRPKTSSMNKNRRRQLGKKPYYRGQGKWIKDQASIQMESSYLIKCHKIIDHHKVEVVVGTADYIQINMASAEYGELEVSKILMYATNGENDILKDNL